MDSEKRHIAKRILLGFSIGLVSIVTLLLIGSFLASNAEEQSVFISLKIVVGFVVLAILIGDRVYVSKHKSQ